MKRRDKTAGNEWSVLLARESAILGAGILTVLGNDYGFTQDDANIALTKILDQMEKMRQMITPDMAMTVYDEIINQLGER